MSSEEYKDMFLAEARDHMDSLNQELVKLEKSPGESSIINNVFRSFHTLKGNSATMGYEVFSKLAHKLEDMLGLLRDKKLKVNDDIMDILFNGCDALEDGMQKIEDNNPENLSVESLIKRIDEFSPSAKKEADEKKKIENDAQLTKKEKALLKKKKIKEDDLSRLIIEFEDNPLKSAKALTIIKKLEDDKTNTIIRLTPSKKDVTDHKIQFNNLEAILYLNDKEKTTKDINGVSKIKNFLLFGINESYEEESKELNKTKIVDAHKEELRKVQEVRIDISRLDKLMDMVGELLIFKMRLEQINKGLMSKELEEVTKSISFLTQNIQNEVIEERMIPLGNVFSRLPRVVRDLSKEEGKEIDFIMQGEDNKLDRTVIDKITDPLIHIIRNCVDHGIETPSSRKSLGKEEKGVIRLNAIREKNQVVIEIDDDGAGIDPDRLRDKALKKNVYPQSEINAMSEDQLQELIFLPGFSTNDKIDAISGRGVGMDVVKSNVSQVGGSVHVKSRKGEGTKIKITLPLTVAIISVLIVEVKNEKYAMPLTNVKEIVSLTEEKIRTIQHRETFILRGEDIPVLRLRNLVGEGNDEKENQMTVIIFDSGPRKIGVAVDKIDSQQQILIKELDDNIKKIKGIAGGTILGDGEVCFILDIDSLAELN
ncbi:chemotaxis protein CheA [Candidatus Woesearchaeota archaeon]|nr:chemotaxis protein CheA [Candidatus Woesearchaeota archaeon]